jgi:hypothetical protein
MPSRPVAFFILILLICFIMKSSFISWNTRFFYERCLGGPKSSDFWPTIKPFLSNKSNNCKKDIIFCNNWFCNF